MAPMPASRSAFSLVCAQTLFPVLSFPLALLLPCFLLAPWLAPDGVVGAGEKDPGLKVGVRALLQAGPVTICEQGVCLPGMITCAKPVSQNCSDGKNETTCVKVLWKAQNDYYYLSLTECFLVS